MVDYGWLPTGFRRKTFATIRDQIASRWRSTISRRLRIDEDSIFGNILFPIADELALLWELEETAAGALDPRNAVDVVAEGTLELVGVLREKPKQGFVDCDVSTNLSEETEFEAGDLIAHVVGQPDNRWLNEAFTAPAGENTTSVRYVSEGVGSSYRAPSGSLIRIAQSVNGWTGITNPLDATAGVDEESIESAFIRFREALGAQGSGTVDSIRADVQAVEGVQQVRVFFNRTTEQVGDLPPKSTHIVVWDGIEQDADDGDIAQAIFDTVGGGTQTFGATSGTASDSEGNALDMAFSRAEAVQIYVDVTVISENGVDEQSVKDSVIERMPFLIGKSVVYEKILAGPASLDEVDDIDSFTFGTDPDPVGTNNVAVSETQIAYLDSSNISVTILSEAP